MHIIVSWDIPASPKYKEISDRLRECLSGFSWVKPLTTFYIVKIGDESDRERIKTNLIEACKAFRPGCNVVISPAMEGGAFGGWLPSSMWPKIRERTGNQ